MERSSSAVLGPDPADLLWVAARPADRRGRIVVEVVGRIDDYTAPLLASCLRGQSGRSGVRALVVDLTGVRVRSGAGRAVLDEAAERCAARGIRLVVRSGERRAELPAGESFDRPAAGSAGRRPHRATGRARRPRAAPRAGGARGARTVPDGSPHVGG